MAAKTVGITSTVPVEIVYAAGRTARDLNNLFITHPDSPSLVNEAERLGMPRSTCAWVKGVYALLRTTEVEQVIGVVQGDCTHLRAMLESLLPPTVRFVPFSFPYEKARRLLRWEMQKLMDVFGVQWDDVLDAKLRLDILRKLAHEIDRRTWEDNTVSGRDNLEALVNCTDFQGDPEAFRLVLERIFARSGATAPAAPGLRLGILGVPGVFADLYDVLDGLGVRVVYHEVARQFAMPHYADGMLEQYSHYTYPYTIQERVADIRAETSRRRLDGYLHYVQSFCHHQLDDLVFRQQLDLPLLTLEGDRVGPLDGRTRTRLEAFIEMLQHRRGQRAA